VLEKYELLQRASKNSLSDSMQSHHEEVASLSAKLHGVKRS